MALIVPGCGVNQTKPLQAHPHGLRRDVEQLAQLTDPLVPLAPGSLDPAFGHQQAGSEMVGDALRLPVDRHAAIGAVEQLPVTVVDDVLELMGQREALSSGRLAAIDGDDPAAAQPVGGARDRQVDVTVDFDAGQIADQGARYW